MNWNDELRDLQEMIDRVKDIEKNGIPTEVIKPEDTTIEQYLTELQKIRQDFDKYIADYTAYQEAEEQREKRRFWQGVLSGVIVSTIAGLVVLAVQVWLIH